MVKVNKMNEIDFANYECKQVQNDPELQLYIEKVIKKLHEKLGMSESGVEGIWKIETKTPPCQGSPKTASGT
jgi:hypothetical protein